MRTMLTQSLAALLPFNVQELNDAGGNYYGINQISRNINVGDRKKLINGNGFIFGVPGSGKSFFAKQEMGSVFLNTTDDVIVIDPMNEYFDIAETYGGVVVNLSAYTRNFVNPLEADMAHINEKGLREVIADKSEFMLSLCDQLLGNALNQKHHSIIDRCVRGLYMAAWKQQRVPVMTDFYRVLKAQQEMEAQELALSLELFVEGSLNIFNHHTNVDVDSRFTVYGIQDLGSQLAPVAMLVMMEAIQQRILDNAKRGRATWLYIDECHVLLGSEYSAKYLQQLWKKVRKQGGLCTGISQNVSDLLQNYIATTLLSNSEFVVLLKQSNVDSAKLAETIGVSDAQLRFVSNSSSGTGLLKCGSVVIPFDNRISKDTDLYRLYNTNLHEKIAEGALQEKQDSGFGNGAGLAGGFMPQSVAQETELSDDFMPGMAAAGMESVANDFMPEVAAPQTEPAGNFMPEMEVPGWDRPESVFAESSSQPDSMALFSEETAPTKIYEPKRHKKNSGFNFPEPEQAAETAGSDWMIYG